MRLFSIDSFVPVFWSTFSAAVIMLILTRYLALSQENPLAGRLKRFVNHCTAVALLSSLIVGGPLAINYYVSRTDPLGNQMPLFEGTMQLISSALLIRIAYQVLQDRLLSSYYTCMFLIFSVLFRTGLAFIVFVAGAGSGLLGAALGIGFGYALYRISSVVNQKTGLRICQATILIIAAGLVVKATSELQTYIYHHIVNNSIEGWSTLDLDHHLVIDEPIAPQRAFKIIWDVSDAYTEQLHGFFGIVGRILGYKDRPTVISVLVLIVFWTGLGVSIAIRSCVTYRRRARSVKTKMSDIEAVDVSVDTMHNS